MNAPRSHDFSRVADGYDRTRAVPAEVIEAAYRLLVEAGDIVPGLPVLEPGCGTGLYTVPFFRLGASMVGLDISQAMLDIVRAKEPALPVQIGSVYELPFGDGTFGAVVVSKLFQHLTHWQDAVDEIRRVTRPGGALIIVHERGAFRDAVRRQFAELADAAGFPDRYLGVTDMAIVADYAVSTGGNLQPRDTSGLAWTKPVRHGDALADHEHRLYAEFWPIPDPTYRDIVEEVRARIDQQPEGPDTVEILRPHLQLHVVRWPSDPIPPGMSLDERIRVEARAMRDVGDVP